MKRLRFFLLCFFLCALRVTCQETPDPFERIDRAAAGCVPDDTELACQQKLVAYWKQQKADYDAWYTKAKAEADGIAAENAALKRTLYTERTTAEAQHREDQRIIRYGFSLLIAAWILDRKVFWRREAKKKEKATAAGVGVAQ